MTTADGSASSSEVQGVALSVLVCSGGRGTKVRHLIDSLLACEVEPSVTWEVVVIDNNPAVTLRTLVDELQPSGSPRLRYVHEPRRGKSHGLNAGLRVARGDALAFTDDDIRVAPTWVTATLREFETHPEISGFGGRVELFDPRDLPIAIRTSRERIASLGPALDLRNIPVIGCNLVLRRIVFEDIGLYDVTTGPGSITGSDDDTDILYRALRRGHTIAYSPDVVVYHDHGRRNESDTDDIASRYMRGRGSFYAKYVVKGDRHIIRLALRELRRNVVEAVDLVRAGHSPIIAFRRIGWLLSGVGPYLKTIGSGPPPRYEDVGPG